MSRKRSRKKSRRSTTFIEKRRSWIQRLFTRFNNLYYDGRLDCDVSIGNCSPRHWMGQCIDIELSPDAVYFEIVLSKRFAKSRSILTATLLHEMAHAAVHPYGTHGKVWQAEMLRLAQSGAFARCW